MVKNVTLVLGVVFLLIGILGFFMSSPLLGLFEVDTVHNVVHLASGIVALFAVSSGVSYARLFLIVFGIVYGAVAVIGFAMNGSILGIFMVNQADNFLHAAIALVCLAVGFGNKQS